MAGTLDGLGHLLLELLGGACQTAGQNLALLVEELLEEPVSYTHLTKPTNA